MSTLLVASIPLDTDGTLAANSDSKVATQKATKTYADTKGVVDGQQIFDGSHVPSFDGGTRQLTANDGSTVALDWSDPAKINIFGGYVGGGITLDPIDDITKFGGRSQFDNFAIADGGQLSDLNNVAIGSYAGPASSWRYNSPDTATYFDNSGFHGDGSALTGVVPAVGSIGSVIAGTKTATGTATTTFTVTIGVTMANNTYKVTTEGDNALSAAVHYVNNKTTTSFDIVYLAGLTGAVSIDWILSS